jgi:tetratricopeptide (TPR) repeat protein
MADYFISYTQSDRDWAFWLGKELEGLGHTPHIHEWEIEGGENIYSWMETRIDAAHHMLCVVSEEYLKAPYSTLERRAGLWVAAKEQPGFVLLVQVKPCRLPRLSANISRCNLVGKPREIASKQFREFITERKPPETVNDPFRDIYAATNIPVRVPEHFMGREDALAAIEAGLGRYKGRLAITALHGLRGVGKTVLAAAYAERHRRDYRATWWIRAQSEPGMRADLVGLGVRLGWVAVDEQEEPALSAVAERLHHEGDGILLIYDNAIDAEGLQPCLPKGGAAKVLVTSIAHAWRGLAEPVEIRLWPKEIGADYLVARTGRTLERTAAEDLSDALGGLPLAHEQAAAYCERLSVPLAKYLRRFAAEPARLLDTEKDAPAEYHDKLTVAKTFTLAIEEAAKLHPAAEPLLVHAALLASEPIPLFLFVEGREKLREPLASALIGDGFDEAVAALRSFALIDRETIVDEYDLAISTDTIRLHRLIREIAASRRESDAQEKLRSALIEALVVVFPREVLYDHKTWPRVRRLDAVALALVGGDSKPPAGTERSTIILLNRLASYRHVALAAYEQARPLYARALAMCEKALGPNDPDTATSLNDLATLLQAQGDLDAARPLFERALRIREKRFGPDHPITGVSLGNLGRLLLEQAQLLRTKGLPGRPLFARARPLLERTLKIHERELGPKHRNTGVSLTNLARLHKDLGELAAALQLFEKALEISETSNGLEHPDTSTALFNVAGLLWTRGQLLQEQGQSTVAQPLFERARSLFERARSLFERGLTIREKRFGTDHPDTVAMRNYLQELAGYGLPCN